MLQARAGATPAPSGENSEWWAPPASVAAGEAHYHAFLDSLLRETVQCAGGDPFETNATAVDSQHRKLFAMADEARELVSAREKRRSNLSKSLRVKGHKLRPYRTLLLWVWQYTVTHFDAEEKTMQEANYLHAEAHKQLHRAFHGQVVMWSEIVEVLMRSKGFLHVGNLFVMVAKWLQDHVCVHDKAVGPFIEKSTLRPAINGRSTPAGVEDEIPDCLPPLRGHEPCAPLPGGQAMRLAPAAEWWVSPDAVAAHDAWHHAFLTGLLESPVVCELDGPFNVTVGAIDAQHGKLFAVVNDLRQFLLERVQRLGLGDGLNLTGQELQPLSTALTWLRQYAVVHFEAEEQLMELLGHPRLGHHRELHRAFHGQVDMTGKAVDEVMRLGEGFRVGSAFVFVAEWVRDHVCVLDKDIGSSVANSRAPLSVIDLIPDDLPSIAGQL